MIDPKNVEIMAPVGGYESLAAAIQAGADSVYFGVTQLNMRARAADNLSLNDIKDITDICREKGIKTYLTVNTLLYNHDIVIMRRIVNVAKENGVDAVIAFDFATIQYCNEICIPVHISVQFSVSNYESLKFFSQMTNRVVLARELTLNQIRAIYERIESEQLRGKEGRLMEIEAFVHGALCVAQSGRCFMSLYTHNASANRGACMQNCRAKYKVTDMDSGKELVMDNHYIMSASDICMIDSVPELLEAGVQVFKIEGRGRKPEYVSTVVRTYKQALKDVASGTYTPEKIRKYYSDLEKVFNRGLSHGNYYLGKEMGARNDVYGSKATEEKEYIGIVKHYFPRVGVAQIQMISGFLGKGDEIYIMGSTTGVFRLSIDELRDEQEHIVNQVQKGDVFTFRVTEKVRLNDSVFKIKERTSNIRST